MDAAKEGRNDIVLELKKHGALTGWEVVEREQLRRRESIRYGSESVVSL